MHRRLGLMLCLIVLTGCNQGLKKYSTAKVTGKIVCNGKPVPNVRVVFAPMEMKTKSESGKPGEGFADANGVFTLSTYGTNDGAVVGKHEVRVDAPPADPSFKCDCGINAKVKVTEVEVKSSGENDFTISLLTQQQIGQLLPARTKRLSKDELADEQASQAASK
jgi:hypothetical protein